MASGIAIALGLGYASMVVPDGAAKRPVSLALGGAAFGVAYLAAYSAFALFSYLSNPVGLSLLGVTAAATAVYAVTRSALSLALLAMVGAFLAPAFAIGDPGPFVVYGYYAAASLLTLMMVVARSWRALIHLRFLFTLGGGVFFAWTAQYYTANHADVMLPMVLLLSAIHVSMPILEKQGGHGVWLERLDIAYALLLPTAAALLAFFIAPTRHSLSIEFMALGAIWGAAGLTLAFMSRPGIALHAVISLALFVLGAMIRFRDLPWELVLLAFTVTALGIVARGVSQPTRLHDVLAGFVVLFGALHILGSNASVVAPTEVFLGSSWNRVGGF